MGILLCKRKMYDKLEGNKYNSGAPLLKRLKSYYYCSAIHELATNAVQYSALDLYGLYQPLLRNLSSIKKIRINGFSQLEAIRSTLQLQQQTDPLGSEYSPYLSNHLCASNERLEHLRYIKLGKSTP